MQSLWMVLASLLFAAMGVCVKLGSARFSAGELVFYRGFIALVLLFAYVRVRRLPLATVHWRAHVARGAAGLVSLIAYFYAIRKLPLATAVTLNYTSPLFLALILGVWAREKAGAGLFAALAVGFSGVALVLQPNFSNSELVGAVLALVSGFVSSIAYYNVRQLGSLGEPEWRTVFYFSLVSSIGGLPWAWNDFHAMDMQGAIVVFGVGAFGALAQLAMTRAYKYGRTLVSASLAYTTVIFSALFGMILWAEVLSPRAWSGALLIIGSGILATRQSRPAAV